MRVASAQSFRNSKRFEITRLAAPTSHASTLLRPRRRAAGLGRLQLAHSRDGGTAGEGGQGPHAPLLYYFSMGKRSAKPDTPDRQFHGIPSPSYPAIQTRNASLPGSWRACRAPDMLCWWLGEGERGNERKALVGGCIKYGALLWPAWAKPL